MSRAGRPTRKYRTSPWWVVSVVALATAVIGLVVYVAAIPGPGGATGPDGAHDSPPPATLTVRKQDITLVTTLSGLVVSTPAFVATSPVAGPVRTKSLTEGQLLTAGTTLFIVDGTPVKTPVTAVFLGWRVPDGTSVPANLPVADLKATQFALSIAMPAGDAARLTSGTLTARAQITNGPGPFDCTLLATAVDTSNLGGDAPGAGAQPDRGVSALCAVPQTIPVSDGLTGLVAVVSGLVRDALVLPVTAVNGTTNNGTVWLNTGSTRRVVEVGLGVTDGAVVQITSGLQEGDIVSALPPALTDR